MACKRAVMLIFSFIAVLCTLPVDRDTDCQTQTVEGCEMQTDSKFEAFKGDHTDHSSNVDCEDEEMTMVTEE